MDDGGRRCALPGCDRLILPTDGRPERRYCTAAHRAAARQARRAAAQAEQADAAPLAEVLPWLGEASEPSAEPPEPRPAPVVTEPAPRGSRDPRRVRPRGRALAALGIAGILVGGYAAILAGGYATSEPGSSPSSVGATPQRETADGWATRATVALTSVNRELDVLAQAEEEWRRLPKSRRAVVPAPVVALQERRSVLERRRTMLQSQLDAYRSLRRAQQELAVSEQQLRAVEKALADGPAEHDAATAALEEQRDLRVRRRDAQRAELASLEEGVAAATRAPLPDDGEATEAVTREVREVVRNGGTEPAASADPGPPRPDVVPSREDGASGPPDPPERDPAGTGRDDPTGTPAPPPEQDEDTLAELRERVVEVAEEARRAEAAYSRERGSGRPVPPAAS
jgi:hypothetical protein